MDYIEVIRYLEHLQEGKIKRDISNLKKVLSELGNPQKKFTSIHIAGTNGKGSISVMIESILREAGYLIGLYTSPHITEFTERIKVSNIPIPKKVLVNYVEKLKDYFEKYNCTYFEAATIICFLYFCDRNIEIAVVETGMGGKWDATNVLNPILSIISDLSIEHKKYLGSTIEKIAEEKGGIIKTGADCIVSASKRDAVKILKNVASNQNANYFQVYQNSKIKLKNINLDGITFDYKQRGFLLENIFIPITGLHQVKNARAAIYAINRLKKIGCFIKKEHIITGLKNLKFDGRFEVINKNPLTILDVGHNPDAFNVIKNTIKKLFPSKKVFLLLGGKLDKDFLSIIKIIKPVCKEIAGVKLKIPDSFKPVKLVDITKKLKIKYSWFKSSKEGMNFLLEKAGKDDIILVAGSHKIVGEIKNNFLTAETQRKMY